MRHQNLVFSSPRWRLTRWLADAGPNVPDDIRNALIASLFGTLPIFAGGVINSVLLSGVIALRMDRPTFWAWFALEVALGIVRLAVLLRSFRAAAGARPTPTDLYLLLGVAWAASVGFGTFISMTNGDWVSATLACLSAAAMVGGICFRNFGAPRLSGVMTFASLGPTCLAAPFSGEPILIVTCIQIPFYLVSMSIAARKLNGLLVATMRAERENEHRARHDLLTGLSNRSGLMTAIDEGEARAVVGLRVALLYLDLDGFKSVNDTYGHAAGDQLLRMAADRLRTLLRAGDVAARMGGDEFVIIARDLDRTQATRLGERLIREIGCPYRLESGEVTIGVSVGVALTPDHGHDLSQLLDVADAALYQAKLKGKSKCELADDVVATVSPRTHAGGAGR